MTDEFQNLVAELRHPRQRNERYYEPLCARAADEIERLASELKREESESEHYVRLAFIDAGANPAVTWKREAERLAALAQSDAEPVAINDAREQAMSEVYVKGFEDGAQKADASAGLIEAAEWLEKRITDAYIGTPDFQKGKMYGISLAINHLRARAADRSGK